MNLIKHDNIFSGILLLSFMAIMIPKELQGIELVDPKIAIIIYNISTLHT